MKHNYTQYSFFKTLFTFQMLETVYDVEKRELSYIVDRSVNWYSYYGKQCVLNLFSHVQFFKTLWTVAHQAPLSMRFSRQEFWSGLPCLPSRDLPVQGSNLHLLCLLYWQVGSLPLAPPGKPYKTLGGINYILELSILDKLCLRRGWQTFQNSHVKQTGKKEGSVW